VKATAYSVKFEQERQPTEEAWKKIAPEERKAIAERNREELFPVD
jgi:hypothetical protein